MAMGLQPIVTTIDRVRYFLQCNHYTHSTSSGQIQYQTHLFNFEGSTSIYIVSADLQPNVTTIDRVIISCQVLTFGAVVDLTIGCR
jgi:hypothetical protein